MKYEEALLLAEEKFFANCFDKTLDKKYLKRARCKEFVDFINDLLPELKPQAGHYGGSEHWWLVDKNGTIYDPTAEQFRPGLEYIPYDPETTQIRLGTCMNCGDSIYGLEKEGHKSVCEYKGSTCQEELERYYNSERSRIKL